MEKEGIVTLLWLLIMAALGYIGYGIGLTQIHDVITNEVYFEHVPADPIPPLSTTTIETELDPDPIIEP